MFVQVERVQAANSHASLHSDSAEIWCVGPTADTSPVYNTRQNYKNRKTVLGVCLLLSTPGQAEIRAAQKVPNYLSL